MRPWKLKLWETHTMLLTRSSCFTDAWKRPQSKPFQSLYKELGLQQKDKFYTRNLH